MVLQTVYTIEWDIFFLLVAQNDLTSLWRSVWSWHIPLRHQTFLMNLLDILGATLWWYSGDVAGLVLSAHVAAAAKGVKWGIPVKGPLYFLTTYPELMQVDLGSQTTQLSWWGHVMIGILVWHASYIYIHTVCIYYIFNIQYIHMIEENIYIWYMRVSTWCILYIYTLYDWYITYLYIGLYIICSYHQRVPFRERASQGSWRPARQCRATRCVPTVGFRGLMVQKSQGGQAPFGCIKTLEIPGYGCFRKWWYPQIIHFNRVFHYKPSILGYP